MKAANACGCDLAAEVAATFGRVGLRVAGTSMVPAIRPGDLISVERISAKEVSVGEIVVFAREGRLIVHRVVAKAGSPDEGSIVTRGDRTRRNDALVSSAELVGRVTRIERGHSAVCAGSWLSAAQPVICRLLRFSDRATNLYLRLAAL